MKIDETLTSSEASSLLGVSRSYFSHLCRKKIVRSIANTTGRAKRYSRNHLNQVRNWMKIYA